MAPMRGFVVAVGVAISFLVACGGSPQVVDTSGSTGEPWLYGGKDVWIPIVDPLGQRLAEASRALSSERPADAAEALREGAAFLESEAERVAPGERGKMHQAASRLTKLAETLDAGAPVTRQAFDLETREVFAVDVDCRWATVSEADWMAATELVHTHLERARELLAANEPQAVAIELRKAAALLRLEAGRADGADRKAIEAAWFELRQLAAKAQVGTLTDVAVLAHGAAHACQTLAQAHQCETGRLWAEHQAAPAGRTLALAAKELERALVWIGAQDDSTQKAAAEEARRVATALVSGPPPAEAEVTKALDELRLSIRSLGERLQPSSTTVPG